MKFERVTEQLQNTPHMTVEQGRVIYDWICALRPDHCLELGFAHGTSSCYIAAALDENKKGHLTTIDLVTAKDRTPNIDELLDLTMLRAYVTPLYALSSYVWELMKIVESSSQSGRCQPCYDFCYVDGAHTWAVDGLAFFLIAKLLRPGGWVLFDDMWWTYDSSPALANLASTQELPKDERCTPQIERVFTLLVRQHPDFGNFRVEGDWAWAQKVTTNTTDFDANLTRDIALRAACLAYRDARFEWGRKEMEEVIRLNAYLETPKAQIADQMVSFALKQAPPVRDVFLSNVFDNLPTNAEVLRGLRREVLGKLWITEAFSSHAAGDIRATRRAIMKGLCADPGWLRNKGVWRLLMDSTLLKLVQR